MAKGLGLDQFRGLRIINWSFLLYDFPLIGTEEPLAIAFCSSFLDGQIEASSGHHIPGFTLETPRILGIFVVYSPGKPSRDV